MANWMAVNLSAPSIPTRSSPESATSITSANIVKASRKPGLPFGPVVRAKPKYYRIIGPSDHEVSFRAGALDLETLRRFDIHGQESVGPDVSRLRELAPQ